MKNLPSVMFGVLVVLVAIAFFSGSCATPVEIERARAETRRQEVALEQARADTKIAAADAFSQKSQAVFPYAIGVAFLGAAGLMFWAWYLRGPQTVQSGQQGWQQPYQQPQLPQPIVINLMLPGAGDNRPAMQSYYTEFSNGQQQPFYLVDAQPAETRDVAVRYLD